MTDPQERPDHGAPVVEVVYLNSNEETRFHAAWEDTLAMVWDEAYRKLEESRRQGDELQCQDGASLMPYLTLTLAQLRERRICPGRKFAIRSETGGA